MAKKTKLPSLPDLLARKLYKTGQTRGADDDVIFQNRVSRSSTVLIPYDYLRECRQPPGGEDKYEKGFIVLISPTRYFGMGAPDRELQAEGLTIGENALVFYETREQWNATNPEGLNWAVATSRLAPLGGQYVARVPGITAENGEKINRGFTTSKNKGAGIRVYEYASSETIAKVRLQLEALFWLSTDSEAAVVHNGMTADNATKRKAEVLRITTENGLLDYDRLVQTRIINNEHVTICPLCLGTFRASGFFSRMQQAAGRAVPDLTVTEINLFHIDELRVGSFNHLPYNVGWGHHHCNVVVRDLGIPQTLTWMRETLDRNHRAGFLGGKEN